MSYYGSVITELFVDKIKNMGNKIKTMDDKINPDYYKGKIQPIDLIESLDLDFNTGNVVKYVARHKKKNGLEDLLKAQFYLDRMITNYKTKS